MPTLIDADFVNGGFELLAGFFVLDHCRMLYAHKQVRGVSMPAVCFFTLWGMWNLYYYPALHQPMSFYGGLFVVVANGLYVGMMMSYRRLDARSRYVSETVPGDEFYLAPESVGMHRGINHD
jgi:ABC-type transport system involved in cytochrome c biogenesis permease subunit